MAQRFVCVFLLFLCLFSWAQQGKLLSGPMQGHTTSSTTKIWLLVENAKRVELMLIDPVSKNNVQTASAVTDSIVGYKNQYPIVLNFNNLTSNTCYDLKITVDNKPVNSSFFKIKTTNDSALTNFSFLTGSCALLLPRFLSPFMNVGTDKIFKRMAAQTSDFMVWSGDYLYYLKSDSKSPAGMWSRQIKTRKRKNINLFLQSMPQYALWDDHDYGSYNGDKDFKYKDTALFLHKHFWANPSFGAAETKGVFTSFKKGDADFIFLDGRFFRTQPGVANSTMLGEEQLHWFFNKLKGSEATFKFIVLGSQMLNENKTIGEKFDEMDDEGYILFPEERAKILNFISDNAITGVVFITGDRHFTELQKLELKNKNIVYDFTCSPITSFVQKHNKNEKNNSMLVSGTYVHERNFGKISVLGENGVRYCLIEVFNHKGKLLWKYKILENKLK